MTGAMAISGSGLAASAAKLSMAATEITRAFASRPEPSRPPPQPVPSAPPATGSVAAPLAPSAAVMQGNDAEGGMVEMIEARAAYRANLAVMKVSDALTRATVDILG